MAVAVEVEVPVGVGVQANRVVETAPEKKFLKGVPLSISPVFTSVRPQLLTVPTTVKAPAAPAAKFPSVQTTFWPATEGAPLAEE